MYKEKEQELNFVQARIAIRLEEVKFGEQPPSALQPVATPPASSSSKLAKADLDDVSVAVSGPITP